MLLSIRAYLRPIFISIKQINETSLIFSKCVSFKQAVAVNNQNDNNHISHPPR